MAGLITVTTSDLGGAVTEYSIAWLSSAGGAVSGNTVDLKRGSLLRVSFVPDGGGTQPTDLYDVTILDADGIDILLGGGGDLSNSAASAFQPETTVVPGTFTPTITNAGDAKGGKIVLVVGPAGAGALQSEPLPVGASTAAKQDTLNTSAASLVASMGAVGDAAVVDPASEATLVSLLKGQLTELLTLSAGDYETVAASQTDQVMGPTGATGDHLAGVLIVPGTTAAGAVSIKDGAGAAVTIFAGGGTTALTTLIPFFVPLGIKSAAGAWSVTTGANVTAIGVGDFT